MSRRLLRQRLSRELGRPWVADLGDPWALDEMMVYPTGLHRRQELRRMRQLLGSAAAIVMSTPEAVSRVKRAFPELAAKPIVAIPNGFDASDFEGVVPERDDGVFRIVHTGYLHTELGRRQRRMAALRRLLGGETRGVDILTRSHVYLLKAIELLLERDPGLRNRIEVHFAGVLSGADREIASRSDVVRLHGYLPHAESIGLIRSADLLFLPMQNVRPGTRSSTVPGKTYEYLASGRPILAAVPDGDARDILAVRERAICRPDDIDGMIEIVARSRRRSLPELRDGSARDMFEYRHLDPPRDSFERVLLKSCASSSRHLCSRCRARRTKVLHLAYYFPPIGGAGAQRTLKFVRYLPMFGYESLVVAGPGDMSGRWTPADATLTKEVAPGTE